jgi:hypothetical protein
MLADEKMCSLKVLFKGIDRVEFGHAIAGARRVAMRYSVAQIVDFAALQW